MELWTFHFKEITYASSDYGNADSEVWLSRMKAQKDSTESDYKIEEIEVEE